MASSQQNYFEINFMNHTNSHHQLVHPPSYSPYRNSSESKPIYPDRTFYPQNRYQTPSFGNQIAPLNQTSKIEKKVSKQEVHRLNSVEESQVKISFPDPHVAYKIMPAKRDKMALDVTTIDSDDQEKGAMILWDYHGGPNQQFFLKRVCDNKFYIINIGTGFVLDVPENTTRDVQLCMNPLTESKSQVWEFVECGRNLYKIQSFCGKVLDVSGYFLWNGGKVLQFEDHNGQNQKWKISPG